MSEQTAASRSSRKAYRLVRKIILYNVDWEVIWVILDASVKLVPTIFKTDLAEKFGKPLPSTGKVENVVEGKSLCYLKGMWHLQSHADIINIVSVQATYGFLIPSHYTSLCVQKF